MSEEDEDEHVLELIADARAEGVRLDHWLRDTFPDRSRALLQKHIEAGAVTIGGAPPKRGASTALKDGDVIRYTPPPPEQMDLVPEDIPLSVLFEDEHLIVIDKPRGLVVHPAAGHYGGTLVNALLHHFGHAAMRNVNTAVRPGIVHRLDRDTTGAIVVAKNQRVHDLLARGFQARAIEKRYLAVVHGVPKNAQGVIDTSYGRHPRDRKKFSSKVTAGKNAITHYAVVESFQVASHLRVDLFTGRTHQIRVHFADLGHPLIGDTTYGKKADVFDKKGTVIARFDRPALHAHRLAFDHPITGARVDITAPIPEDLTVLLGALGKRTKSG